jgi:hypothetical protein
VDHHVPEVAAVVPLENSLYGSHFRIEGSLSSSTLFYIKSGFSSGVPQGKEKKEKTPKNERQNYTFPKHSPSASKV